VLIEKLTTGGGISVRGVNFSKPLPAETSRQLSGLYEAHGLLVIRDQKLTKAQLVEATEPFGGPEHHPAVDDSDPEVPGVTVISTRGPGGETLPDDAAALVGDIDFHTDQAYITAPNRGKLLYAVDVPEKGGLTGFIDGTKTYEELPETVKARIDGLHVIQSWRHAQETIHRNRSYRHEGGTVLADDRFPDIAYPIVVVHPHSGQKVLNVPPLWCSGVVELPGAEGQELVDELKHHILQPKYAYWHRYMSGDVVGWDNWRFLHAAGGTPGRYLRTLWSVVIRGGPQIGEKLSDANS
jgi:taurine dioxygenase